MDLRSSEWQQLAPVLVYWGGFFLAVLGGLKLVIFLIGEFRPGVYGRIKSEGLKKFLTGSGNRLVFGLLGFFTAGLGVVFMFAAKVLQALTRRYL